MIMPRKATPLFEPEIGGRPMRVAGFMSGSGSNIRRLIERTKELEEREGTSPFEVIFIFSDRSDGSCQGEEIAFEYGIPYFSFDVVRFHHLRGLKRTVTTPQGRNVRKQFDAVAKKLIDAFEIDVIALGGYMSYVTLNRCVNVHPADLSILTPEGARKYTGDHAVIDAISAGETVLRSSTLWTDKGVDTGPLLMVSEPLQVELPVPLDELLKEKEKLIPIAEAHQERLKEIGDWHIFPKTLEMIARGRFSIDEHHGVYVDGGAVPRGYRE